MANITTIKNRLDNLIPHYFEITLNSDGTVNFFVGDYDTPLTMSQEELEAYVTNLEKSIKDRVTKPRTKLAKEQKDETQS
jgi:hypothetical protein